MPTSWKCLGFGFWTSGACLTGVPVRLVGWKLPGDRTHFEGTKSSRVKTMQGQLLAVQIPVPYLSSKQERQGANKFTTAAVRIVNELRAHGPRPYFARLVACCCQCWTTLWFTGSSCTAGFATVSARKPLMLLLLAVCFASSSSECASAGIPACELRGTSVPSEHRTVPGALSLG